MSTCSELTNARIELAHTLGFPHYPKSNIAQPYLNYIENQYIGDAESLQNHLDSLRNLVRRFTKEPKLHIQAYIEELCGNVIRQARHDEHGQLADQVMISLGIWLMSLEYFRAYRGIRHVERALCVRRKIGLQSNFEIARENSLPSLLKDSGLFPSPTEWESSIPVLESSNASDGLIHSTLESTSIKARRLNAYTLSTLGDIRIYWTTNLSRHLLLCQRDGHQFVEVFALPCVLEGSSSLVKAGVPGSFIQEVRDSYFTLFSPFGSEDCRHQKWGRIFSLQRWCWCSKCSSRRLRQRELSALKQCSGNRASRNRNDRVNNEFDPMLEALMENEDMQLPEDWSYDVFPCLWPRILLLENRLQSAKPWRFGVLFKDKRDTLQYWTFL
jgi:hypothetical protein